VHFVQANATQVAKPGNPKLAKNKPHDDMLSAAMKWPLDIFLKSHKVEMQFIYRCIFLLYRNNVA
jgi:hypothetical protein